jgi:hypothetical protein
MNATRSYKEYKADLLRWSRLTTLDKGLQGELVLYLMEGHPSNIKRKIRASGLGRKLLGNERGVEDLLTFLDDIYEKDEAGEIKLYPTSREIPTEFSI